MTAYDALGSRGRSRCLMVKNCCVCGVEWGTLVKLINDDFTATLGMVCLFDHSYLSLKSWLLILQFKCGTVDQIKREKRLKLQSLLSISFNRTWVSLLSCNLTWYLISYFDLIIYWLIHSFIAQFISTYHFLSHSKVPHSISLHQPN